MLRSHGCCLPVLSCVTIQLLRDGVRPAVNALLIGASGGVLSARGADCIVNAANEGCVGGGGVDGAINEAGGPDLIEARRALHGCATGSAKATAAFGLAKSGVAKWIVHAVGPDFRRGSAALPEAEIIAGNLSLLRSAYRAALVEALRLDGRSIVFCLLSAGIYRGQVPLSDVVNAAVSSIAEALLPGKSQLPEVAAVALAGTGSSHTAIEVVIAAYTDAEQAALESAIRALESRLQ